MECCHNKSCLKEQAVARLQTKVNEILKIMRHEISQAIADMEEAGIVLANVLESNEPLTFKVSEHLKAGDEDMVLETLVTVRRVEQIKDGR